MSDPMEYKIDAMWSQREEIPAMIAARFQHLVTLFQKLDPVLHRWFYWPGIEGSISLDRPGLDLAHLMGSNPSRNEWDEPEPWWGYHFHAYTAPDELEPTDFQLSMMTGAEVSFNHLRISTYDPASARYDTIKGAMLAIMEAFEPEWCSAKPLDLLDYLDMSRYSRPPMPIAWMTALSPPIAKLVTPPVDVISERQANGTLFMAATQETFVTANPAHLAAARTIEAVVDPLNFILPFNQ